MGYLMPDPEQIIEKGKARKREQKRWMVLKLVEAQIAGCVDLSPEEMVDAAFIMVDKINQKLYESKDN